ncbi:hypothetical protein NC651_005822 [Populus alba x Populus x berolinensis]|nr:hypothetical protein NC651_005822 [Populus alba x Populus x berolinensis]
MMSKVQGRDHATNTTSPKLRFNTWNSHCCGSNVTMCQPEGPGPGSRIRLPVNQPVLGSCHVEGLCEDGGSVEGFAITIGGKEGSEGSDG